MYQCPKCKGWIDANDGSYRHECVDTLAKIAAKVAEHKDYQLAVAAYTVLRELVPPYLSPAYNRAYKYLGSVDGIARGRACMDTWHLTPRRRWQDKDAGK